MAGEGVFIHQGALQAEAYDPRPLVGPEHGALASFIGTVRNEHLGKSVTGIDYECYPAMALNVLNDLVAELKRDHGDDLRVHISHGTGWMDPTDAAVAIHVTSAHRAAAFAACRQAIERLKEDLPVWKHEHYADGTTAWLKGS